MPQSEFLLRLGEGKGMTHDITSCCCSTVRTQDYTAVKGNRHNRGLERDERDEYKGEGGIIQRHLHPN